MGMKPNIMKKITNEYQQTCHSDMSQAAQKVNPSKKRSRKNIPHLLKILSSQKKWRLTGL